MTNVVIHPRTGRHWAAVLEQASWHWWLVLWQPALQQLIAFWRGPWEPGGIYCTGRDPVQLWPLMCTIQHEGRRQAMRQALNNPHIAIPPVLTGELPDALWWADG